LLNGGKKKAKKKWGSEWAVTYQLMQTRDVSWDGRQSKDQKEDVNLWPFMAEKRKNYKRGREKKKKKGRDNPGARGKNRGERIGGTEKNQTSLINRRGTM